MEPPFARWTVRGLGLWIFSREAHVRRTASEWWSWEGREERRASVAVSRDTSDNVMWSSAMVEEGELEKHFVRVGFV